MVLAALRFSIGSYWVNAYHGGFLAAIGGALVAGAFPRLRDRASVALGLALGMGLAILAATRPFEGMLFSLPFIAVLVWRQPLRSVLKTGIPAVLLAGAAVAGLGVYFSHVTGSPFVTTYQISQKTYGWPMGLAWVKPPKIEHRHVELKRYYEYELSEHEKVDGPVDFIEYLMFRVPEYWRFFLGPALSIPLLMLGRVWRRQRMLLVGLAGAGCAVLLEGAASPHYLAPATAVIVAVLVECCRHLRAARIAILPLLLATMVLVLGLRIAAQNLGLPYTQKLNYQSWCCKVWGNMNKRRITETLQRVPGRHLVFVTAKTDENNLFQWIYNDADIDASPIVWARDLGPQRNALLQAHLEGRQVWMVDPNVEPATCRKYEETHQLKSFAIE
jgi:MFS family permease